MRIALRCAALAALATTAALAPSAGAQAPAPADAATPVVVADQRFAAADIAAAARRRQASEREVAEALIRAAWMRREAAARHLAPDGAALDAVVAEDRREATADGETYEAALERVGLTPDERRAQLADGLAAEAVGDALLREAHGDAAAYGRAWRALEVRERAVTTCTAAAAPERRNWCANRPVLRGACTITGLDDVCRYPGLRQPWGGAPDLIVAFLDPRQAVDAAVDPEGDDALARLGRYLRAHRAAAARHCDFDADDLAYYSCTRRAYAIDVAYAVARIHATAKRHWSVPATAGALPG
jgi:hypothetical protein